MIDTSSHVPGRAANEVIAASRKRNAARGKVSVNTKTYLTFRIGFKESDMMAIWRKRFGNVEPEEKIVDRWMVKLGPIPEQEGVGCEKATTE